MISSSVKEKWNSFLSDTYTKEEWFCTKLAIVLLVGPGLVFTLFNRSSAPFPIGLCKLIDCNLALADPFRWAFAAIIIVALLLFLAEVKMVYTTFSLFLLTMVIYSIEESNGLRGRNGILSLMFLAHFFAYLFQQLKWDTSLGRNRIQFTAQFIAAAYLLAAISKLTASGLAWVTDSPFVALQILKSFDYAYFDTGIKMHSDKGIQMAAWISQHVAVVKFLFGFTLVLELCAFTIMLKKKIAFFYSLLLMGMHFGMLIMMDIFFPTISIPLIIFLINPFYLIYLAGYTVYYWKAPALVKSTASTS
jgi:hypothetical protein